MGFQFVVSDGYHFYNNFLEVCRKNPQLQRSYPARHQTTSFIEDTNFYRYCLYLYKTLCPGIFLPDLMFVSNLLAVVYHFYNNFLKVLPSHKTPISKQLPRKIPNSIFYIRFQIHRYCCNLIKPYVPEFFLPNLMFISNLLAVVYHFYNNFLKVLPSQETPNYKSAKSISGITDENSERDHCYQVKAMLGREVYRRSFYLMGIASLQPMLTYRPSQRKSEEEIWNQNNSWAVAGHRDEIILRGCNKLKGENDWIVIGLK